MKPTFVRVGVPKSKTRAPLTVHPPTEGGNPASNLSNLRCYTSQGGTTHDWLIPSGRVAGDGLLMMVATEATTITPPSGYTEIGSEASGSYKVYWKISDGTETDTTFTTNTSEDTAAVFGRIPSRGATLSTPDVASPGSVNGGTTEMDPAAVTPAAGAGTYHMIVVLMMNKGGPPTTSEAAVSTGYTFVTYCDVGNGVLSPGIWIQKKDSTAIVTTEDPDAVDWTASVGSRIFAAFTIAVAVATADPAVVGYPVTASDIDTESATDGQVLTSDGAGNAAWEDVPGGVTNGDSHDHSGGDGAQIDHGGLAGLTDDDHTQYLLADGTRALSGDLSMGSNKLTNVTDPTSAQDAATKAYVDANGGDYYEVIVSGSSPPVAVTNEAGDDWVYGLVP